MLWQIISILQGKGYLFPIYRYVQAGLALHTL